MKIVKLLLFMLLFIHTHLYAKNGSLEKVTLQLQWKHQFEFAGFYAAKEKGFYKDVGLDVSFVEFDKTKNIVNEVVEGKAQYGVSYSSIIADYLNGKDLILLANFLKQSPLVLVTQENIKTLADLKGKKVMGLDDSIDNITLLTMLNKFGIQTSDFETVPASFNLNDFIHKKVDAMSVFTTNELYDLNQKGIKYTLFDPVVYGSKYYDVNLFTSQKEYSAHPKRVQNFKNASIKGWEYALKHQEEIVTLILKKYNTLNKSRKALLFEAKQIEQLMLPNVYKVGSIDPGRIKLIAESFMQLSLINPAIKRNITAFIDGYRSNPLGLTDKELTFIKDHPKIVLGSDKIGKQYKNTKHSLDLSDTEKHFLVAKKEISMCVDPSWMPYEMIKNGKYIGISADYIQQIASLIHTPFTLVHTKTWSESLALFKEEKCDILPLVAQTPLRKTFMDFTKPYITSALVIATDNDKSFISDLSELKNKKIGIIRNYATTELLQKKYLNINFVEVNTLTEGLELLSEGKLHGFIDSLTTLSHYIQQRYPGQLKISGQLNEKLYMGIATHKNQEQLLSILNQAVNIVQADIKQDILNHWITVKFDHTDYSTQVFQKIVTPILLLIILLIISHYILRQYNKRLKNQVSLNIEALREQDEILLQKYKMAAMGEMLSMIAHQWRQPLSAINSAVMGIDIKIESGQFDLSKPIERQKFLIYLKRKHNSITDYVQHLSTTTDDFRNFFNPNKNKDRIPLTLPIESALKIVESSMKRNGIDIIKDFEADTEVTMFHNEIMQVILNLFKNSEYNFIDKEIADPVITISTFSHQKKNVIRICDNGGGIPKEVVKQVFDPYYSTKDEKNGTGLGLYMSKIIVEKHHSAQLKMINSKEGVCFELIFKP